MIREAQYKGDHTRVVQISHRYGMILFIASEVMFFVAWFWAFFNSALFPADRGPRHPRRALSRRRSWPPKGIEAFDPWHLPLLNTLLLLTSGTTVTWAHHALLENDRQGLKYGLILTILLGATFTCVQAYEYSHAAFHFSGNIYGATFFMATGFHGFHVLIGTIFLIVCLARAYAGQFTPDPASRLRIRRLVLAFRRRGVAVPVHLHLCLGHRRRPRGVMARVVCAPICATRGRPKGRPFCFCDERERPADARTRHLAHPDRERAARHCLQMSALRQGQALLRGSSTCGRNARPAGSTMPSSTPATGRRSSSS